jgi:molybdopterin biosynthesis enzyme
MTMRPIAETLLYDDAMRLVMSEAHPTDRIERVPLADAGWPRSRRRSRADGCAAVRSRRMDGYAVIAADTSGAGDACAKMLTRVDARLYRGSADARRRGWRM